MVWGCFLSRYTDNDSLPCKKKIGWLVLIAYPVPEGVRELCQPLALLVWERVGDPHCSVGACVRGNTCAPAQKKKVGGKKFLSKWHLCGPTLSRVLVQMTSRVFLI